ncbi:transcription factor IIIA-like [Hetaerina americana]|uniref:transcription factor IIIA-like n=1 Tax=Hetaerina americana TaxID=62018 RepID=UPI003A7F10FF
MGAQSESSESSCEDVTLQQKTLSKRSEVSYKCDFEGCTASFKKPSRLKQHQCSHTGERPFKCDWANCDRAYTHACHLKRHIATNHQATVFRKAFKCTYTGCNLFLSNETNLRRHYRRKHEKLFLCKECGKSFTKNRHLRVHLISHNGYLSFRCPDCNIGFASEGMLRKHQHSHKIYACNVKDCKEKFQKWTRLRHHLKVAHPLEYVCAVCEKKFTSKSNISCHVKSHLRDRPSFPCPYPDCIRSYVRDTYLANHIKWFHEGKGVKCTYEGCGRMLCTKARLTKHMAWHEKARALPVKSNPGKSRRARCDKGVPRRSMAAVLAGIPPLPLPLEKKIINGATLDSEEDLAIKDLGEADVFSLVCEPSTSSAEAEKNIVATTRELPLCSY